jgi:hypothetical protein
VLACHENESSQNRLRFLEAHVDFPAEAASAELSIGAMSLRPSSAPDLEHVGLTEALRSASY